MAIEDPYASDYYAMYPREVADRMLARVAMTRIKAAVRTSNDLVLDLGVGKTHESNQVLWALKHGEAKRHFLDVPLASIVAVGHKNFAEHAGSWRALLDGLHGIGWGNDTIAYFESPIGEQRFPAPSAREVLKLEATGGMVTCTNGVHRLVAAVCWLAATRGAAAVLKKVRVSVNPIHTGAKSFVLAQTAAGRRVDIALTPSPTGTGKMTLFRVTTHRSAMFYVIDGPGVRLARDEFSLIDRARMFFKPNDPQAFSQNWHTVTPRLADALADDAWLQQQLAGPLYADLPS